MTGHSGMAAPVDGCDCRDCAYARWFASLDPKQLAEEIALIYAYEGGEE